ncbi:MAG: ABC transporter substrate-binding protein [Pseudomonadota bacterium]
MRASRLLVWLLAVILASSSAVAAESKIRIAEQFGLAYLPLRVAIDRKLIEQQAAKLGLPDATVEVTQMGSGVAVNDAIITGGVDIAMAGATVLLILWDKTVGRNTVKGMMAIADSPIYFNTVDPRIHSIRDFGEDDRIAMNAGRGTQHFLTLQMAAAQAFGWDARTRLDALTLSMAHPDGVVALLSGGAVIKTHATTVPFIQMELADPRVRTVLNSYDVVGGRHSLIVAYCTEKWRRENPKLFAATYAGLSEAMDIIQADKYAAALLFKRVESTNLSVEAIDRILADENMLAFTPTPSKMMVYADYMAKVGLLKNRMDSWKDAFFDNVHALPGS